MSPFDHPPQPSKLTPENQLKAVKNAIEKWSVDKIAEPLRKDLLDVTDNPELIKAEDITSALFELIDTWELKARKEESDLYQNSANALKKIVPVLFKKTWD